MKCPKEGCEGAMYSFQPHDLVTAICKTFTGVKTQLQESEWKQLGFMCGTCGHMEFYTQDPGKVLHMFSEYFENTEPETD